MNVPDDRHYTDQHEWALLDGDVVKVGITDYAQDLLDSVVWLNLPEVGRTVAEGEMIAEVDATKTVGEVYAPLSGTVSAVHDALIDNEDFEAVNRDPYGEGWLVAIAPDDAADLERLLDSDGYRSLIS